jgi:hypothetical protein
MGPRIYPSQQDTNLTAKGSLLLSEDVDIAVIDVYVNNVLAAKEYSTVEGLYVVGLNIGDVVRLEASTNFNIIAKRFNYTTDYENGDNGVKVTELGTTVGISAYTFTVTTLANSYNFEYYLDTSPFFINLIYEYSGITNPDNLYTIATTSQRVTLDGRQFNIPSYTYSSDTGFTYNIGQVFITGGTSQSFDTRTILDPISGGNCVRWQFGSLGVYQNDVLLEPFTGTAPVSTPVCNASKTFELGVGPFNLVQNATYKVRRIDTSQNIAPTPTPTASSTPTPTPSPTTSPTPTASSTPTLTPTPTPTPGPFTLTFFLNVDRFSATPVCNKSYSLEYSIDSGATYTTVLSVTSNEQVISRTGSTITLTEGTYSGFRVRRRCCKFAACGTYNPTFDLSAAAITIGWDGPTLNSVQDLNNFVLPVCPSENVRTFNFTPTTFNNELNEYWLKWVDFT